MKKLYILLGIALFIGATAYPVQARGPGWGRGNYPGYGGSNAGYGPQSGSNYGNLTEEQRAQLDKLHQKFYDETAPLRNEMRTKWMESNNILNSSDPNTEKIKALQKEINDLRAKLGEKRIDFDLEVRKIVPKGAYYGKGYGRGYAGLKQGRGPGTGYRPKKGYGPGYCR